MRKKNPSPPLPRMPVTDDVYAYAASCKSLRDITRGLHCSAYTATRLRKGDRTLRVSPLDLDFMQRQVKRLSSLSMIDSIRSIFIDPPKNQVKHIELVRLIATFVSQNKEQLLQFKRKKNRPRFWSVVSWHKPLYAFVDSLFTDMIPHLKKSWHDMPECRSVFFSGTGFEDAWIKKVPRKKNEQNGKEPSP